MEYSPVAKAVDAHRTCGARSGSVSTSGDTYTAHRIRDDHDPTGSTGCLSPTCHLNVQQSALVMALGRRDPHEELLHHADKGPQHTSLEFSNRLADWKIRPSFGSTGDCFDNAAMESTWATLKREIAHIHGDWTELTRSQGRGRRRFRTPARSGNTARDLAGRPLWRLAIRATLPSRDRWLRRSQRVA